MSGESTQETSNALLPSGEELKEWLRPVMDPELHLSLVALGLVYAVNLLAEGHAKVDMTLTSPGCPLGGELIAAVEGRLRMHPAVKSVDVAIVWDPPWDPRAMADDECKDKLNLW